jgi:diaminopimelate epimerase
MNFSKYQGTGNDFILINNWGGSLNFNPEQIQLLCDRKFGIGADGLILIEKDEETAFFMNYYNSDGSQSFCGNGSRCAVQFAIDEDLISGNTFTFRAIDGIHESRKLEQIQIQMLNVQGVEKRLDNQYFVNTGSPHLIQIEEDLDIDVDAIGRKLRNEEDFKPGGTNVNFMKILTNSEITIRTYERGVEAEPLSCGTGVTACALVAADVHQFQSPVIIHTCGGELKVSFDKTENGFENIWLIGPAEFVFKGEWYAH